MLRYKKGQVGETISWVIATLIIIGILTIFIYVSVLMSKVKKIDVGDFELSDSERKINLLSEKTSFAHKLAGDKNKKIIDNILEQNG